MDDTGFSGVVKLSNISDFIAPSLDCIIPLKTVVAPPTEPLVNIRPKSERVPSTVDSKGAIKVSLNDCLACNGCITSAETVLVEEQSLTRLLEGIKGKQLVVISVSPQSVCSIAAKRKMTTSEVSQRIAAFFISQGAHFVVDSSFARIFCHTEAFSELEQISQRPLLTSACPGFVCYAEKSHGNLLVPLISRIRSPQAVMGALVKDYLAKKFKVDPCDVFHATVMPCFDKKLEASRTDFLVPGTSCRETDCVVSTAELDSVLEGDLTIPSSYFDSINSVDEKWLLDFSQGHVIGNGDSTSGGYAENIVRQFVASRRGTVVSKQLAKNLDQTEVVIDGVVALRVACVYGFRNIQNLVRKIKTGKASYDYVEIMACPGGCGNGGGQIRGETSVQRDEISSEVEFLYKGLSFEDDLEARRVASDWIQLNPSCQQLLRTDYRPVVTNISQNLKW